jgi:hypothetical protein
MNEISENTAEGATETAEWSDLYLGRLARCLRLSSAWRLYLAHNPRLRTLLEHVTELSYRDCVQNGLKDLADRLVQTAAQARKGHGYV